MARLGRFEILAELGQGGMGVVFKARDPLLKRLVAIKQLTAMSEDALTRFHREARTTGQLRHENIVTVYEVGENPVSPYIVMEFIDGPSLRDAVEGSRPLPIERKLAILSDVLHGLGHAHERGIYHRDIKPANVMINPEGRAKIVDFGIAKLAESEATRTKLVLGTLPYMSPEQVKGEAVDSRTDLFSVGVMLYELLTGHRPFDADDTYETMRRIACDPAPPMGRLNLHREDLLHALVDKALAKERSDRFQTAADMAKAIDAYRGDLASSLDRPVMVAEPSERELFEQGKRHYRGGDYWRAKLAFEGVLKKAPGHGPSQVNLAQAEKAWHLHQVKALEKVGILLWKKKEYGVAVRTFEKLLSLEPSHEDAPWLLVRARRSLAAQEERRSIMDLMQPAVETAAEGNTLAMPALARKLDAAVDDDTLFGRRPEFEAESAASDAPTPSPTSPPEADEPRERTTSRLYDVFKRFKDRLR